MFNGFWPLEATVVGTVIIRGPANQPIDADSPPTYRVYSQAGVMPGMTGTLVTADTGTITAASNASPIVITSAGHNRVTGDVVKVSGVAGNTAANGTFSITFVDSNNFSLNTTTGNGSYTSGGVWHQAGVYQYSFLAGVVNGFSSAQVYWILVNYLIGSLSYSDYQLFIVT
jgi:Ubiquitin-activating enzyme E1 FCCH domain